jgi:hypothetical protein
MWDVWSREFDDNLLSYFRPHSRINQEEETSAVFLRIKPCFSPHDFSTIRLVDYKRPFSHCFSCTSKPQQAETGIQQLDRIERTTVIIDRLEIVLTVPSPSPLPSPPTMGERAGCEGLCVSRQI